MIRTALLLAALLPCPFCGAEDDEDALYVLRRLDEISDFAQVICRRCEARGPKVSPPFLRETSEMDAAAAWNTRDGEAP